MRKTKAPFLSAIKKASVTRLKDFQKSNSLACCDVVLERESIFQRRSKSNGRLAIIAATGSSIYIFHIKLLLLRLGSPVGHKKIHASKKEDKSSRRR